MSQAKFTPSFDSLYNFECPSWFKDAKFGIWSHWGPQSVPMFGDWYARHMYIEGSAQYNYHCRHYGHPSKFGYKDICALWKAEKFDPDELMELYYKAGARYFVAQAMHHDNFFNYASKINRFNSVDVGPGKDICGLWKKAADKYNMPFGLTEHLAASFSWWAGNKGADKTGPYAGVPYDASNPEYADFYHANQEHIPENNRPWYTKNKKFHEYWLATMKELIDLYHPDMLYSDGDLPFGDGGTNINDENYKVGLEAVSYLYNDSIAKNGENRAIYTQKNRNAEIFNIGLLDIEKSQLPDIPKNPWQTDTCIGGWFYHAADTFKKPAHIIEMLIDIVSKNGCMLLNILQKPDGSIDDETRYLLTELAEWNKICGDAIYATRPWRQFGEGDSKVVISGFREDKVDWNSSDYRFTQKGNKLYAFMMAVPENRVSVIKSLTEADKVKSVKLLGCGEVPFSQAFGTLTVKLPENMPTKYTNCLEIEF